MCIIHVSSHAAGRFKQRDPRGRSPTKLLPLVRVRLHEELRKGMRPDRRGAIHVGLGDGLTAICYPAVGRWEVATVKIWGGLGEGELALESI